MVWYGYFLESPIRGKFGQFCRILAGKKSKFAEKSANLAGFSREKSQNSQNIGRFRGFQWKKIQISKDFFRGKLLGKSADFTGNFGGGGGEFAKKQSVKTADFAGFFLANFAKINQFCIDMTSVVKRFFNRDNHLLFQEQFAREMSEC